jgi:hypothetical protein
MRMAEFLFPCPSVTAAGAFTAVRALKRNGRGAGDGCCSFAAYNCQLGCLAGNYHRWILLQVRKPPLAHISPLRDGRHITEERTMVKSDSHRHRVVVIMAVVVGLTTIASFAAGVRSQVSANTYLEVEPNNTCLTAQNLPLPVFPIQVQGFKTQPFGDAVDFYRFTTTPGTQLRVTLNGDFSKPNPLTGYGVGLFSSDCPISPSVSSFTIFSPAQFEFTVPPDGKSVIAVTACCDTNFSGSGTIEGAYLLSVEALVTPPTPPTVVGVQTYGSTYGELSARWWQWLLSIPKAVNPNLDPSGADCMLGQVDDVWFLAGSFGGVVERSCMVPTGKPLFFPLINTVVFKPQGGETLLDLRGQAAAFIDAVIELECTLDGAPCFEDRARFRVRSPSFSVMAPAKGLVPPGELSVPGNTDPIVSDGYWLLLDPPSPGSHVIKFKAATGTGFSLDVTYNLTIQ